MSDYLVKALAFDGNIRAFAIDTTEMIREAQRRQGSWPTASAALGRAMTASTMMASMLKGESNKLTVKIEGGGPIGAIIVDANVKVPHIRLLSFDHENSLRTLIFGNFITEKENQCTRF